MDYDALGEGFAAELERVVAFSGQDLAFFAELKARALLDLLEERLDHPSELDALDVGCGLGLQHPFLGGRLGRLTGVDIARKALDEAARRNPQVHYVAYDGSRLPFDDGSFDVAFGMTLLHILPPVQRPGVVRELARVVRPGGLVVFFEHNPWNPLTRLVVRRAAFATDVVMLSRRESTALLRQAGLDTDASRYYAVFPWRSELLRRFERRLGGVPLGAQYYVSGRRV